MTAPFGRLPRKRAPIAALAAVVAAATAHGALLVTWTFDGHEGDGASNSALVLASTEIAETVAEWRTAPVAVETVRPPVEIERDDGAPRAPGSEVADAARLPDIQRPLPPVAEKRARLEDALPGVSPLVDVAAPAPPSSSSAPVLPARNQRAAGGASPPAPPLPGPVGAPPAIEAPPPAFISSTRPAPRPAPARAASMSEPAVARRAVADASDAGPRGDPKAEARWAAAIRNAIARHQRYPAGARHSGRARVVMTIRRDGALAGLSLAASSGSSALDRAALDAVRRAAPFPPAPDALRQPSFTVGQWVTFEGR